MQFGLFGGARTKRGVGLEDSQGYESFIDYVIEADRLGFKQLFMVEHHFTDYAACPDPLQALSYVAAKTKTIKLMPAAVILPWNDPLRVVEKVSMLDSLSEGRVVLGMGRGAARRAGGGRHRRVGGRVRLPQVARG